MPGLLYASYGMGHSGDDTAIKTCWGGRSRIYVGRTPNTEV